jgi:hypothetical protein
MLGCCLAIGNVQRNISLLIRWDTTTQLTAIFLTSDVNTGCHMDVGTMGGGDPPFDQDKH